MHNTSTSDNKPLLQKTWVWNVIAIFWGIILAKTVIDGKLIYSVIVVLSPLLLYLFISKPFIFPFGLYALSLPFESLLVLTGSYRGPTLSKYLAALSICAILLKGYFEGRLKKPDSISIWWVLFIFYGFLSITWGLSQAGTMRLTTGLGLLILYLVISSYQIQRKEYEQIKWILIIAGVVAALLTVYSYQMVLSLKGVGDRTSIVFNNRMAALNSLPFDMLLSISLCIAMIIKQKKIITKGLFLVFIITFFFAIILTGSRSGLSAAISILIVYLLYIKNLNNKMAFLLVIILVAVIIIPYTPEFMVERIKEAFEGSSVEGHASGRTDIWIVGLYALKKYWLFGAGLDNFPMAYDEFVDFHYKEYLKPGRAPHNTYLGFFVELGIIGISFLFIALFKHYRAITTRNSNRPEQIMLKATFCGVMVSGLAGDILWDKMFWFLFMMIIMHRNSVAGENPQAPVHY